MPSTWRERLREAVARTGKKQWYIAEEAGITSATLSRILTGTHRAPGFETVVRITHAAGETVGWLLDEPGFALSGEQRAKVRTAGAILLDVTGGPKR
jgi:transcriptional regulator with XRE-family HTH domain